MIARRSVSSLLLAITHQTTLLRGWQKSDDQIAIPCSATKAGQEPTALLTELLVRRVELVPREAEHTAGQEPVLGSELLRRPMEGRRLEQQLELG